jgi:hypothetical protein
MSSTGHPTDAHLSTANKSITAGGRPSGFLGGTVVIFYGVRKLNDDNIVHQECRPGIAPEAKPI